MQRILAEIVFRGPSLRVARNSLNQVLLYVDSEFRRVHASAACPRLLDQGSELGLSRRGHSCGHAFRTTLIRMPQKALPAEWNPRRT